LNRQIHGSRLSIHLGVFYPLTSEKEMHHCIISISTNQMPNAPCGSLWLCSQQQPAAALAIGMGMLQ
jgi:hypothetical protein